MPKFPTKETDILALVESMIAGYAAHPADFPNIVLITLLAGRIFYNNARKAQIESRAQMRLAVEAKLIRLRTLKEAMKSCLKKSEVDTAVSPEKLALIGWAPREHPQPVGAPTAPRNLRTATQGQTKLRLKWDRPACGGAVRNYIVQRRRQPKGGGEFGSWEITATSLENEINLQNQPRSVQMEYRVKAVNVTGESTPSNVAAVVL